MAQVRRRTFARKGGKTRRVVRQRKVLPLITLNAHVTRFPFGARFANEARRIKNAQQNEMETN